MASIGLRSDSGRLREFQAHGARRWGLVVEAEAESATALCLGFMGSWLERQADLEIFLENWSHGVRENLPSGDYSVVARDSDRWLLARDRQGRVPLYMLRDGQQLLAADTSLSALAHGRDLDREYFCRYLVGNLGQQIGWRTPYASVERIPPGGTVEVAVDGRILRQDVTKSLYPMPAGSEYTSVEMAAVELGRLLRGAVKSRLGKATACHLSGGWDSTAVSALAASIMSEDHLSGELVLLSAVFATGELEAEGDRIAWAREQVRKINPATRFISVAADSVADFDHFTSFASFVEEPNPHAFREPLWSLLSEAARAADCDALLTGCGADPVVDARSDHLLNLLRLRRFSKVKNDIMVMSEAHNRPIMDTVSDHMLLPLAPILVERLRALRRAGAPSLARVGQLLRPSWVREDFAREYGYADAMRAAREVLYGSHPDGGVYVAANFMVAPDLLGWSLADRDGFLPSHPFLDARVVGFMSSLPDEIIWGKGRSKALLERSMAPLVALGGFGRVDKVSFNQLYSNGLRRHKGSLIDMCRSASHPLVTEALDIDALVMCLEQASLGVGNSVAWDRLNAALSMVAWLESSRQAPVPREHTTPRP